MVAPPRARPDQRVYAARPTAVASAHLEQAASPDVVQEAVDRDARPGRADAADPADVIDDAAGLVLDRQPVDIGGLGGTRAAADVVEAVRSEGRGLEAVGEQVADHLVGEELHAAVGVMDDEPLGGAEQLVRDDDGPDRIVAGAAAGIADDVRVTLAETGVLRRVEPGVHAGEDPEPSGGWQREVGLGAERAGIGAVGGEDLVEDGRHGRELLLDPRVARPGTLSGPAGRLAGPDRGLRPAAVFGANKMPWLRLWNHGPFEASMSVSTDLGRGIPQTRASGQRGRPGQHSATRMAGAADRGMFTPQRYASGPAAATITGPRIYG